MPRRDRPLGTLTRAVYRRVPLAQRLVRRAIYAARELMVVGFRQPGLIRHAHRVALRHSERAVPDPALRAKLTPSDTMGCKRVAVSDAYPPALARPNVEVVTAGIAEVHARSIVDRDGVERPPDAIIFGTGSRPTDPPLAARVRGRGGRTLRDAWGGGARGRTSA